MYKLMIVDDELLERQALRFFVEQSNLEIDEIIECASGMEAVQVSLTEKPHICILDIRMPGLNGLETMNQIRAVNKDCKVIFSSAYSYFDYAVKAMQLGALDFLTKPVKKETIVKVLNKAIDQLDEESNHEKNTQQVKDITYVLEKRILRELVSGQSDEETLWFLDIMGFGNASCGATVYIKFERVLSQEEKAKLSIALRSELSAAGIKHLLYAHRRSLDMLVFYKNKEEQQTRSQDVLRIVTQELDFICAKRTMALTFWSEDLLQIELSYIKAKEQLGEYISQMTPSEELLTSTLVLNQEKIQVPIEIDAMCQYMKDNFAEKITLHSITDSVGFSKYYASRMFKKHMGITIIDYLIDIRIAKAKEYLTQGEYSIKQISYMTGYADPNYFTWSFKKYVGVSPMKYRYFQNLNT